MRDISERGRARQQKLTVERVRALRECDRSEVDRLASDYGISPSYARNVRHREKWQWV